MKRILTAAFGAAATLVAAPASAVTLDNGIVLITQADAVAGGITPGDTPGFPVTLSETGSYRFASNLLVSTLVNGIEVRAPEVTIDMNGFRLAGSAQGRNGITSFFRALTVMNGSIRGFTLDGVRTVGQDLVVDNMRITDNGRNGVIADDFSLGTNVDSASITNSDVSRNVYGVTCTRYCLIQNNTISGNSQTGFTIHGLGGIVLNNTVTGNLEGMYIALPNAVGVGNTTLLNNSLGVNSTGENFIPMDPNACSPAC